MQPLKLHERLCHVGVSETRIGAKDDRRLQQREIMHDQTASPGGVTLPDEARLRTTLPIGKPYQEDRGIHNIGLVRCQRCAHLPSLLSSAERSFDPVLNAR